MEFTGERFIPGKVVSCIHYEHVHRYHFAAQFAHGARVLDIGSGEGYGAAILAPGASSVVGIDVSTETIEHATSRYALDNLTFRKADARTLPFDDNAFDLVTSFEMIEHISESEQMLSEARRVLAPNGRLIISSPNKHFYHAHDLGDEENEFHVRELELAEFENLVREHFQSVVIMAQHLALGSYIWSPTPDSNSDTQRFVTNALSERPETESGHQSLDPVYAIAVCATEANAFPDELSASLLLDNSEMVVRDLERQILTARQHMRDKDLHIEDMQHHLRARDEHITDLLEMKEKSDEHIAHMTKRIGELDARIQELRRLIRNPFAWTAHVARKGFARLFSREPQ